MRSVNSLWKRAVRSCSSAAQRRWTSAGASTTHCRMSVETARKPGALGESNLHIFECDASTP